MIPEFGCQRAELLEHARAFAGSQKLDGPFGAIIATGRDDGVGTLCEACCKALDLFIAKGDCPEQRRSDARANSILGSGEL